VKLKGIEMAKVEKVFSDGLSFDLFAGFRVKDYALALNWYERLLGCPPAFLPNDIEAVWELEEHRYLFIEVLAEHAGHTRHLIFLSDLDAFIAQIEERGLNPTKQETLSNGVRKVTYQDPDGNEIEFGGAPKNS
jgi:catechol 2,3-dioxygenase-like lactoylglutathione lyase family enzyme